MCVIFFSIWQSSIISASVSRVVQFMTEKTGIQRIINNGCLARQNNGARVTVGHESCKQLKLLFFLFFFFSKRNALRNQFPKGLR